jgi:hypothetical protein
MLRKLAGVVVLVLAGSLLAADPKGPKDSREPADTQGVKAKVVRVDAAKKVLTVTLETGKAMDYTITPATKFIGPRGGVSAEGLKDDRLAPGAEVRLVPTPGSHMLKEVHLPVRKRTRKGPDTREPNLKGLDRKGSDWKESERKER